MRDNFFWILVLLFLSSCATEPSEQKQKENNEDRFLRDTDLQNAMYGVWEDVYLKTTSNVFQDDPDSVQVFEVLEENWENLLMIKPSQMAFSTDSKFNQYFRQLDGSPYDTLRGLWKIKGDTLSLITPIGNFTFEVTLKRDGIGTFRTILDGDGDGQADDENIVKKRMVGRDPKALSF